MLNYAVVCSNLKNNSERRIYGLKSLIVIQE